MNRTFHQFGDLPLELRLQIWNLALRPTDPGAHVFRLFNCDKDHAVKQSDEIVQIDSFYYGHRLASPRAGLPRATAGAKETDRHSTTASWTEDNPSAYLIDGGLWTACRESRLVMESHYKSKYWDDLRRQELRATDREGCRERREAMIPATAYFSSQDSGSHHFTVFPHRDLFIFQPENLKTINWSMYTYDLAFGSPARLFCGLQHIALEYDPEWGYQVERGGPPWNRIPIIEMLAEAAFDGYITDTMWFIDYSLKRKPTDEGKQPLKKGKEGRVFYAGDRRFVEVRDKGAWDYIQEAADGTLFDSPSFIYAIESAMEDRWEWESDDDEPRCSLGLLACEYL
ncbi:hypothetical protein ACJ41O_007662 [Fusarium nematophilum]